MLHEPIKALEKSSEYLEKRGTGRGRKPREGSRFKLTAGQEQQIIKYFDKKGKEVIYFHNLSTSISALTAFAVTAKSRKTEGNIRILKPSENVGWRDANEYEEAVYNTYIKTKIEESTTELADVEIYGTILDDGHFRIIDKSTEDLEVSKRDARKINRGRICLNGWKKNQLFEVLWKLKYNPFTLEIDLNRDQLIKFITMQGLANKNEAKTFSNDRLKLYYSWGTSGSNIKKICTFLEEYFEKNNILIRD